MQDGIIDGGVFGILVGDVVGAKDDIFDGFTVAGFCEG